MPVTTAEPVKKPAASAPAKPTAPKPAPKPEPAPKSPPENTTAQKATENRATNLAGPKQDTFTKTIGPLAVEDKPPVQAPAEKPAAKVEQPVAAEEKPVAAEEKPATGTSATAEEKPATAKTDQPGAQPETQAEAAPGEAAPAEEPVKKGPNPAAAATAQGAQVKALEPEQKKAPAEEPAPQPEDNQATLVVDHKPQAPPTTTAGNVANLAGPVGNAAAAGKAAAPEAAAPVAGEAPQEAAPAAGNAGNAGNAAAPEAAAPADAPVAAPVGGGGQNDLLQQLIGLLRSMGFDDMANMVEQMAGAAGGGQAAPAGNAGNAGNAGGAGGGVAAAGGPAGPGAGPAGPIAPAELQQAAGGDPQIMATLQKIAQDPDGAKALRDALDRGTTFQTGQLAGNVVGRTVEGGGRGPVITLEDPTNVDTAAHELAHAAYPGMDHGQVYMFGHKVAQNLGERVNNNGGIPPGIRNGAAQQDAVGGGAPSCSQCSQRH